MLLVHLLRLLDDVHSGFLVAELLVVLDLLNQDVELRLRPRWRAAFRPSRLVSCRRLLPYRPAGRQLAYATCAWTSCGEACAQRHPSGLPADYSRGRWARLALGGTS